MEVESENEIEESESEFEATESKSVAFESEEEEENEDDTRSKIETSDKGEKELKKNLADIEGDRVVIGVNDTNAASGYKNNELDLEMETSFDPYIEGEDSRIDFIFDYASRTLKIKKDKWENMLQSQEQRTLIYEFFDRDDMPMLIVNLDNCGQITVAECYPPNSETRSKSCYFIKKDRCVLGKEDYAFKDNLIYGDLHHQPLENLLTFIEDIISPLINTDQSEVNKALLASLDEEETENLCFLKGRVFLPLPISIEEIDNYGKNETEDDLRLKIQIETLILQWSRQINEYIREDTISTLDNPYPTPFDELEFWQIRVKELDCVYKQLNQSHVRKIASILEDSKGGLMKCPSSLSSFKTLFRNVVAALSEAQDILTYLKPLKKHLESIVDSNYQNIKKQLGPLMHCVCLIWANSRYYSSPARIINLLQEICNLLIELTKCCIEGNSILYMHPEDAFEKTDLAYNTLVHFRQLYDTHKEKLHIYFENQSKTAPQIKEWDFLPYLVFKRYDKFVARIKRLRDHFEIALEFSKIEDSVFGGAKGKDLNEQFQYLSKGFVSNDEKFQNYDVTDTENEVYAKELEESLESKAVDIDQRLATIISNAFDDCHTPDANYKLIIVLDSLLEREALKDIVQSKYLNYIKMIEQDLDKIQELFHERIENKVNEKIINPNPTLPYHSGIIIWAKGLQDRASEEVGQFNSLELNLDEYVKEEQKAMLEKYNDLNAKLTKFMNDTFNDWLESFNGQERENSEPLFEKNPLIGNKLKEVKYMRMAGFEIPPELAESYDNLRNIRNKTDEEEEEEEEEEGDESMVVANEPIEIASESSPTPVESKTSGKSMADEPIEIASENPPSPIESKTSAQDNKSLSKSNISEASLNQGKSESDIEKSNAPVENNDKDKEEIPSESKIQSDEPADNETDEKESGEDTEKTIEDEQKEIVEYDMPISSNSIKNIDKDETKPENDEEKPEKDEEKESPENTEKTIEEEQKEIVDYDLPVSSNSIKKVDENETKFANNEEKESGEKENAEKTVEEEPQETEEELPVSSNNSIKKVDKSDTKSVKSKAGSKKESKTSIASSKKPGSS